MTNAVAVPEQAEGSAPEHSAPERTPPSAGERVLISGHLALGGATVVIMAFSLAFVCTLENGDGPWTWPAPYSTDWFVAISIAITTVWALWVTCVVIGSRKSHRTLSMLTAIVATGLGVGAMFGLLQPWENSALQLWLVSAMNLGYQAAHLRSVPAPD